MVLYIQLILPVVWAIVSVVLALALYKSSSAFFEQVHVGDGAKRTIRLFGSIVIAGCIYFALQFSTPINLLKKGEATNSVSDLKESADAMALLQHSWTQLQACTHITLPQQCDTELSRIDENMRRMQSAETALQKKEIK